MKKIVTSIIFAALVTTPASAFNAQKQHELYRSELDTLAKKQHAENQRYMLYYKGSANYTGTQDGTPSVAANKKDIYAKKGVKFKVDEVKQEQKLKEVQAQEEKQKADLKTELKPPVKAIIPSKLNLNNTPKLNIDISKVNVNIPKSLSKPAIQKTTPVKEQINQPLSGKNADAE